jgi:multiple sugar transport system substrate-binding protein
MPAITRRSLLGLSAAAATGAVAGCTTAQPQAPGERSITWWDHNVNLQKANRVAYDAYTAKSGIKIDYTYHQTAKIGQALQLAKQSNQQPDVHSTAGLESSIPSLIADGWFSPIEWSDDVKKTFEPLGGLVEGLHSFDGKLYTFPIFADRQYVAATWFNRDMITKAGLDPANPPKTFDEFRAACRAVQDSQKPASGMILSLAHTGRMAEHLNSLAMGAGFAGLAGQLFSTGEFAYHDDAYVAVFEFLASLQADKLIFPGSSSLDDQTARVRWAAGAAGFYLDGPWCSGTVQTEAKQFLPSVDVGPMLQPEAGRPVVAYRGQGGGNYYIAGSSDLPAEASELLTGLATKDYWTGIANAMAQPPYDLSVVEGSTAIEPWKRLVGWFADSVFIAPQAVLRNQDVQRVNRFSKAIKPGLGELLQGVFSGQVPDIRGALKKLSDDSAADREQALKKAVADGAELDADAWAFPDWKPGADYKNA